MSESFVAYNFLLTDALSPKIAREHIGNGIPDGRSFDNTIRRRAYLKISHAATQIMATHAQAIKTPSPSID